MCRNIMLRVLLLLFNLTLMLLLLAMSPISPTIKRTKLVMSYDPNARWDQSVFKTIPAAPCSVIESGTFGKSQYTSVRAQRLVPIAGPRMMAAGAVSLCSGVYAFPNCVCSRHADGEAWCIDDFVKSAMP